MYCMSCEPYPVYQKTSTFHIHVMIQRIIKRLLRGAERAYPILSIHPSVHSCVSRKTPIHDMSYKKRSTSIGSLDIRTRKKKHPFFQTKIPAPFFLLLKIKEVKQLETPTKPAEKRNPKLLNLGGGSIMRHRRSCLQSAMYLPVWCLEEASLRCC